MINNSIDVVFGPCARILLRYSEAINRYRILSAKSMAGKSKCHAQALSALTCLLIVIAGSTYAAGFDIPTGVATGVASPSPLFGASEFSAPLLLFEEFGLQTMPVSPL